MSDEYRRYKERAEEKSKVATGSALAGISGLSALMTGDEAFGATVAERALALDDVGAKGFDPGLMQRYLQQGPYALIGDDALDTVQKYVPSGYSDFLESDLSKAGIEPPTGGNIKRQITVSPSAQPRRLSYEGLTESDLDGMGQKGYIWANPEQPQYGYAAGNFNRGRQVSRNPAINFLDVDMPPERQTRFATTGEVVADENFATQRDWGQRDFGPGRRSDGDVMFPKESIRRRAEVTAADVFTDAQRRGFDIEPGDFSSNPGKAFKELVESAAEKSGKNPLTYLQELATEVPALGESQRFAGQMPVFEQFMVESATPENLRKSGIGSVFVGTEAQPPRTVKKERRLYLESDPEGWNPRRHFEVNPALINTKQRPGQFLRRQSGAGLTSGLSLALDPSVNKALAEGRHADAALQGGASIAAGAITEALAKRGLEKLAAHGITTPLRVASTVASPLGAIQLATLAPRSTPKDWGTEEYYRRGFDAMYPERIQIDGEEYGYNRSSNKLAKVGVRSKWDNERKKLISPPPMGLAYKDGKPVAVPYGSVKGRTMAGQIFGLLGL